LATSRDNRDFLMLNYSFNLPKYRLILNLKVIKRRKVNVREFPFIPKMKHLRRFRGGNIVSRFFRHIFEHSKINKILGGNLAFALITGSLFTSNTALGSSLEEELYVTSSEPLVTKSGIQYPVETIRITQGYHFFHPGVDLDGITGDVIRPVMTGIVENITYSRIGYGNSVIVNHGNGIISRYAHLSTIKVKEGQEVDLYTQIGEMGSSGRAFGDHLHFEIIENGVPINPTSILK